MQVTGSHLWRPLVGRYFTIRPGNQLLARGQYTFTRHLRQANVGGRGAQTRRDSALHSRMTYPGSSGRKHEHRGALESLVPTRRHTLGIRGTSAALLSCDRTQPYEGWSFRETGIRPRLVAHTLELGTHPTMAAFHWSSVESRKRLSRNALRWAMTSASCVGTQAGRTGQMRTRWR